MKIEITHLNEKLQDLRGIDFEECEKQERAAGNYTPMLQYSSAFLARLGAMALGLNPHEVKNLPLNQYATLTTTVSNFLFTLEDDTTINTANA